MIRHLAGCVVALSLTASGVSNAQDDPALPPPATHFEATHPNDAQLYVPPPMTARDRINWIVTGIAAPRSLGVAALSNATDIWWTTPDNETHAETFARRFMAHELDTAISRSVEGALGALWGEDPRPRHSHREGIFPRAQHAMQIVLLAPRSNGHLGPAWGRIAGQFASNVAANAWLPENERTVQETGLRLIDAFVSRLISNLWEEFWPDLREKLPPVPRPFTRLSGQEP